MNAGSLYHVKLFTLVKCCFLLLPSACHLYPGLGLLQFLTLLTSAFTKAPCLEMSRSIRLTMLTLRRASLRCIRYT
ncbi:hypothetical protein GGR55DRAFT_315538 [Xylaria sp. FL0064]|nr:hypothetical protein GGR55DRAFT_315538 [Xylaria sp. FL0064]